MSERIYLATAKENGEPNLPGSVVSGSRLPPSLDTSGAADTAAIRALLAKGGCACGRGPLGEDVFYVNEQLVVPDGTAGTPANGYLLFPGVTIRQAAGANIKGPLITTSNFAHNVASDASIPVEIKGLAVDVNASNQTYTEMPGPDVANGPDAVTVFNNRCKVDIDFILNPARHGLVTVDETPNGTKASGTGYDCTLRVGHVDGDETVPFVASCVLTARGTAVTTSESVAGVKVGMVVVGQGIAPNTTVTAVEAGGITLSQNALISATVTLYFGFGQRAFWNANLSGNGLNNSELASLDARHLFGDVVVKNANAGGWITARCHSYACAYSGADFEFTNGSSFLTNEFGNGGQIQGTSLGHNSPMATTNAAFATAGGTSLAVEPLPVAIAKNKLLCFRTGGPGGGPLYLKTSAAAAAGATSISFYTAAPTSEIATGTTIYMPLVAMQVMEGQQPNSYSDNFQTFNEESGSDYVYYSFLGFATAGKSTTLKDNHAYNGNSEGHEGSTSAAAVFISRQTAAEGLWSIGGASSLTVSGQGVIHMPFQANCRTAGPFQATGTSGLIQFVDGAPVAANVELGTPYITVAVGSCTVASAQGAAEFLMAPGLATAGLGVTGNGNLFGDFWFDPADYAVAGKTVKCRLVVECMTPNTASTITHTVALAPVASVEGATTELKQVMGAVIAASKVAFENQAEKTIGHKTSGDFVAPAAGLYALVDTTVATNTTNCKTILNAQLQVHLV